jgi:hypothetical protein
MVSAPIRDSLVHSRRVAKRCGLGDLDRDHVRCQEMVVERTRMISAVLGAPDPRDGFPISIACRVPAPAHRRWSVAAAGPRPVAGGGAPARAGASGVGASQGVGDVPPRRPTRLRGHRAAATPSGEAAAGGELPAGTPPARRPTEGGVRGRADRAEPGLAAGLTDFETTSGGTWRLADCRDYLVQVRTRLAQLPNGEPTRRDQRDRTRPR